MKRKTNVLIISGYFLPGYKHGGIQKSIVNTIDHLRESINFTVITRNHDVGEENKSYQNIKYNQLNNVDGIKVRYLKSNEKRFRAYIKIIKELDCDILHLNSFFDPLSIYVLIAYRFGIIKSKKIILSNRGEFAWASLKIKFLKKIIYICLFKLLHLQNKIVWHVSTKYEKEDTEKYFSINSRDILTAIDLPKKNIKHYFRSTNSVQNYKKGKELKLIFLSRISPEKNLDLALKILSKIGENIIFHIYGTIHDNVYWQKCENLMKSLPKNIKIKYLGPVKPHNVEKIFAKYDMFLFPSGGENFSHVIYESLSVGTTVLISKNTPWKNLQKKGLGWDVDIRKINKFVSIIQNYSELSKDQLLKKRKKIINNFSSTLIVKKDIEANKKLYLL